MKKTVAIISGAVIVCVICCVFFWNFLGLKYMNKETADTYQNMIPWEDGWDGPTFYLPDEYHFYGRYDYIGETFEDGLTPKLSVVDDRMVYRCPFTYKGTTYYFYYSDAVNFYKVTYPDIYNSLDEKVARLGDNPEGCFIQGNYLYYAYGKDFYHVRVFTAGFITGHDAFAYQNFKDYRFARLNLDTMTNEDVSREVYELAYDTALHSYYIWC